MKKFVLLMTILGFVSLNAEVLTLQECIDKSLENHPDIKTFMLKVSQSEAGIKSAKADYLPQISLSGEYDLQHTYALPQNGVFHTKDGDGWQAGVVIRQKLWDFSKTTSAIDAAKKQKEIDALSLLDAQALLVYRVKQQYALMLVQQKAIDVRQRDIQAKERLYAQAQGLVKQGMKTKADALRFSSSLYVAKENLAIAKAAFEKAKNSLSLYMGEKIEDHVSLQEQLLDESRVLNTKKVDFDLILRENPTLKSARETIEKSTLNYKGAKSSRYGSIDALASYNHQDTLNAYDASTLGITLNIPLYAGGRMSAQTQQAKIAKASASTQYKSKVLALKEEFEALMIDLNRYSSTIASKKAQLCTAKATQALLEARYKEGLSTYIEVLDAKAFYLGVKLGLLETYYAQNSLINRINYLQGKIK